MAQRLTQDDLDDIKIELDGLRADLQVATVTAAAAVGGGPLVGGPRLGSARLSAPTFAASMVPEDGVEEWLDRFNDYSTRYAYSDQDKLALLDHALTDATLRWWRNLRAARDPRCTSWQEVSRLITQAYHVHRTPLQYGHQLGENAHTFCARVEQALNAVALKCDTVPVNHQDTLVEAFSVALVLAGLPSALQKSVQLAGIMFGT